MSPPAAPDQPVSWTADEAVERLYVAHYRGLVRLAVLLLRDLETAEDVVQEAFVSVHQRWGRMRDPESAVGYLRTCVVNGARSAGRRRGIERRGLAAVTPAPEAAQTLPGVDQDYDVVERRARVLLALQALPQRQREVVVLRHYADLDEAGVAATLGISRGAVKSHAHRAALRLRELLEDER